MRLAMNEFTTKAEYTLEQDVAVYAEAGFTGMEIVNSKMGPYLEEYSVADLKKLLEDHGMEASGYCFYGGPKATPEAEGYQESLEGMAPLFDTLAEIGCKTMCVIPAFDEKPGRDLVEKLAEAYAPAVERAARAEVKMGLEFIGPSPHFSALATAAKVCRLVDSPYLGVTLDFMHFTLGKSKSEDFALLRAQDIAIVHLDDAPDLAREITTDYDRVYPGVGDYPLVSLLEKVAATGYTGPVSLELFNKEYAQQDPLEVAKTGYEKSKAVMEAAGITVE